MTKAKDADGPWSPLVNVMHIEKWEDPCPFWDEDGQAYLGRSIHGVTTFRIVMTRLTFLTEYWL